MEVPPYPRRKDRLLNRKVHYMKGLLTLPALLLTLAVAGCATSSEPNQASNPECYNLTGAALVECQKTVAPAAETKTEPFKMVKPQKGAGGMRGGMY